MSTAAAADPTAEPAKASGKKKLLLLAVPLVLGGAGAGLWFSGILPSLFGIGKGAHSAEVHTAAHGEAAAPAAAHGASGQAASGQGAPGQGATGHGAAGHGGTHPDEGAVGNAAPAALVGGKPAPVFFDLPDMIANLNAGPRRTTFIKLHAKLELAKAEDQPVVAAAMPRLLDLFQTYLREMRPEELRGSAGTYRLREELLARADLAVAPVHIIDVLFTEMLVQ